MASYGRQAIWLVPAFAFAEACIGIGLFVSGAFLVIIGVTLLGTENATLVQITPLAFAGALAGDHVGYWLGRRVGPGFHHTAFAARYQKSIAKAENMIRRFGGMAIFVGRFIPAIRSVVPGMLGIAGFRPGLYSLLDVLACLLWSLALATILAASAQLLN